MRTLRRAPSSWSTRFGRAINCAATSSRPKPPRRGNDSACRWNPKQTKSLVVEEARREQTTFAVTNVTSDQVALFVREKSINKTVEDALEKIVAQKAVVADLENKKSDLDDEQSQIFDDQQRLRENMKSLKGSAEEKKLLERYTQQLDAQENRLEALRKEMQQLDAQKQTAQTALDKMIEELSLDVKL